MYLVFYLQFKFIKGLYRCTVVYRLYTTYTVIKRYVLIIIITKTTTTTNILSSIRRFLENYFFRYLLLKNVELLSYITMVLYSKQ